MQRKKNEPPKKTFKAERFLNKEPRKRCKHAKSGVCGMANSCLRLGSHGCKIAKQINLNYKKAIAKDMASSGTPVVPLEKPIARFQCLHYTGRGINLICREKPELEERSYKPGEKRITYIWKDGLKVAEVRSIKRIKTGDFAGYYRITISWNLK